MSAGPHFLPFDLSGIEPVDSTPEPDRVVKGEPRHRTWNVEETPDGKVFSGVWESSAGTWRVNYDEWEFCSILAGISILHEDGADAPHVLREGDTFVIRPGFKGLWEVVETTRKHYVVRLP